VEKRETKGGGRGKKKRVSIIGQRPANYGTKVGKTRRRDGERKKKKKAKWTSSRTTVDLVRPGEKDLEREEKAGRWERRGQSGHWNGAEKGKQSSLKNTKRKNER